MSLCVQLGEGASSGGRLAMAAWPCVCACVSAAHAAALSID